ncbi:MAG: hypothetical protein DHS20C14_02080 [Phycisphaeraceae bacterium]|nr:MAG: hypothetical protein DHS20C14_02080 [Phycisphaeraceae bacterium]
MRLLRKHMLDDAGKRVPVYRTGIGPWALPYECPLTPESRDQILARSGSGWSRTVAWTVLLLSLLITAVAAGVLVRFPGSGGIAIQIWFTAVAVFLWWRYLLPWVVGNWTGFGSVGVDKLRAVMLDAGRCPSCGYELAGQTTCPECAAVWKAGA